MGAGTNIGAVVTSGPDALEEEKKKVAPNAAVSLDTEVEHPATLIDTEIETLYSGFQKRRKTIATPLGAAMDEEKAEWQEAEDRAKRLRREEAKVRALNSNGRVDYSIQE
jgi:rubrerythrin